MNNEMTFSQEHAVGAGDSHETATPAAALHCSYCSRRSISRIFAQLRLGTLPDLVAKSLGVSIDHVLESRGRGRSLGCFPKATAEERRAEHEAMAALRYGKRECEECGKAFTPALHVPNQATCNSAACKTKRKNRQKMAAQKRVSVDVLLGDDGEREPPTSPAEVRIAGAAAKAEPLILTGEASYALWGRCLGVEL